MLKYLLNVITTPCENPPLPCRPGYLSKITLTHGLIDPMAKKGLTVSLWGSPLGLAGLATDQGTSTSQKPPTGISPVNSSLGSGLMLALESGHILGG